MGCGRTRWSCPASAASRGRSPAAASSSCAATPSPGERGRFGSRARTGCDVDLRARACLGPCAPTMYVYPYLVRRPLARASQGMLTCSSPYLATVSFLLSPARVGTGGSTVCRQSRQAGRRQRGREREREQRATGGRGLPPAGRFAGRITGGFGSQSAVPVSAPYMRSLSRQHCAPVGHAVVVSDARTRAGVHHSTCGAPCGSAYLLAP